MTTIENEETSSNHSEVQKEIIVTEEASSIQSEVQLSYIEINNWRALEHENKSEPGFSKSESKYMNKLFFI